MKIAVLAPPWIPVPPPGYGSIEQVVELLSAELVRRGHDITLLDLYTRAAALLMPIRWPRSVGAAHERAYTDVANREALT